MAKSTEAQNPEEEVQNITEEVTTQVETSEAADDVQEVADAADEQTDGEAQAGGISIMVSQTKDGETKVADTLDEGWEADGVAIVEGGETLLIVALNEAQTAFGGFPSEDLEEDIASPSMSSMDGQMRSAFLMEFLPIFGYDTPALTAAAAYGWLPSGGEMTLISAHREAINAKLEELGGTAIGEGKYWTSQKYSNDRMWHCDMATGDFGIALGTSSTGNVRAVRK